MKYFIIFYRSILAYFILAGSFRIMGKREIGELSVMDLIVSIFIANVASITIENHKVSILSSLIPIIVLVTLQLLSSYIILKNHKVRKLIDGTPSVIINRGKVNFKEMKKQRYNLDDLLIQLREKGIKTIEEVDYAILETSGNLSVFRKDIDRLYPIPLIIDGIIDKETLIQIGKSEDWLDKELFKNNINIDNIFYCFYKNKELYIIEKDKIK